MVSPSNAAEPYHNRVKVALQTALERLDLLYRSGIHTSQDRQIDRGEVAQQDQPHDLRERAGAAGANPERPQTGVAHDLSVHSTRRAMPWVSAAFMITATKESWA